MEIKGVVETDVEGEAATLEPEVLVCIVVVTLVCGVTELVVGVVFEVVVVVVEGVDAWTGVVPKSPATSFITD
jgi:hypothetical protein